MSEVWETKDGLRRVRRDPPTLDDAVLAAQGLTEDIEGQIEIVAALMSVTAEDARRAVLKMRRPDSRLTIPGRGGVARAVVVERKSPRRLTIQAGASTGRAGVWVSARRYQSVPDEHHDHRAARKPRIG